VWSRSDWVSGALGYYDRPIPPWGKLVHNIEHLGSSFPGTAHTEYWTAPIIRGVLHTALTGNVREMWMRASAARFSPHSAQTEQTPSPPRPN
jgi:hypothetical protein